MKKCALLLLAGASLLSTNVAAQETNAPTSKVSKVFDRELPNVPGKSIRAVLVEYGPGAGSPSHRHPSSAFIYATVLEGEIRSKVNDDPEHVFKAGESRTEMPGDHHKVRPTPARPSLLGCWRYSSSIRRSKRFSSPTNSDVALAE